MKKRPTPHVTDIGGTAPVPAHLGSPGKRAVKWVCVCVHDELLSVLFVGDYDQLLLTYYNSTLVTLKVMTEHQ